MTGENGEGHVDELDESTELDDLDVVILTDEDGNEREFAVLAVVELEEGEGEYAALASVESLNDDNSSALELYLVGYAETEDGVQLTEIEDEEIFRRVQEIVDSLIELEDEE